MCIGGADVCVCVGKRKKEIERARRGAAREQMKDAEVRRRICSREEEPAKIMTEGRAEKTHSG